MKIAILSFFCFGATLLLTLVVGRLASRFGIVDQPSGRRVHTAPTPRGAGIALVVVVTAALALSGAGSITSPILIGAVAIGIMGLIDDIRPIPIPAKLLVQLTIAATVVILSGGYHHVWLPFFGSLELGSLATPVSIIFIVGAVNAYNFLDGIDGLAGGQAILVGITWVVMGAFFTVPDALLFGSVLAASSLAFLVVNWHPARIFLGDSGSHFLGFLIAAGPISFEKELVGFGPGSLLLVAAILWVFIFDALFTRLKLVIAGTRFWTPHRAHFFQILVEKGWKPGAICILYFALATAATLPLWSFGGSAFSVQSGLTTLGFLSAPVTLLILTKKD